MTKDKLIEYLIENQYLRNPKIIEAFRKIDRQDFVPADLKPLAYVNEPLSIGQGQTISQPLTVAFMLDLLDPQVGEKILDIGSGSGWQTALLAYIVSKVSGHKLSIGSGQVIAIEKVLPLKAMTEENVEKYGFIKKGIVKVIWDDGSKGYEKESPYDKIIAAAAADKIPEAWKKQLKVSGRLVTPVGHSIIVLDKISETEFKEKEHFGFSFVPLVSGN